MAVALILAAMAGPAWAAIEIDREDDVFFNMVTAELERMRRGDRGLVSQALVFRLDESTSSTQVRPVTAEESTWHPNDRKGTRSHVVPGDTKIQGAARTTPTAALIYVHPSRVDSSLSLFRLGTFVYCLALAADLNRGEFSADFKIREKRAAFFMNAWKDAAGFKLISISNNVPTPEYQKAKELGLITEENTATFPILSFPNPLVDPQP